MPSGTWTSEIEGRISAAMKKLAEMMHLADELNLHGEERAGFLSPYRATVDALYTADLRLAQLLDGSDLVVGAKGPLLKQEHLPVTTVIGLLDKTRGRILDVAKTIVDISKRVPSRIQPSLYGLAPGSVYLGFAAPEAPEDAIFGDETPYFAAVRAAMRAIGMVSHLVVDLASDAELADAVPDPGTRDAAVTAVRDLAPSSRSSYDQIVIAGGGERDVAERGTAVLDVEDRQRLRATLTKPATTTRRLTFVGTIREMDLDKRRFYLRQIEHLDGNQSIRGAYDEQTFRAPREFLDRRVRVTGEVEADPDGRPRMMFVSDVELLDDGVSQDSML